MSVSILYTYAWLTSSSVGGFKEGGGRYWWTMVDYGGSGTGMGILAGNSQFAVGQMVELIVLE